MDLRNISLRQTKLDIEIANIRVLELSVRIKSASDELLRIQTELSGLPNGLPNKLSNEGNIIVTPLSTSKVKTVPGPHELTVLFARLKNALGMRGKLACSIDEVCGRQPQIGANTATYSVARNEFRECTIRGWALPRNPTNSFIQIDILLASNEKTLQYTTTPLPRPDVGAHFGKPALSQSGFRFEIPMVELIPGVYKVTLLGRTGNGTRYQDQVLDLEVR